MLVDIVHSTLFSSSVISVDSENLRSAARSYAVLRLHDAWFRFAKRTVLTSALGNVVTATGSEVYPAPGIGRISDAEQVLKADRRGWKQWGPAWDLPAEVIDAARVLNVGNSRQLALGFGAATYAVTELKAVRNVLAHRHSRTAMSPGIADLRYRVGASRSSPAIDVLPCTPVHGGIILFEEWRLDLLSLARVAIQ